jgi:hypothetical protein
MVASGITQKRADADGVLMLLDDKTNRPEDGDA